MNILDPIQHDFELLAKVLKHGRPSCPLIRAEKLAGLLVDELIDTGQAPEQQTLESALFRAPRSQPDRWYRVIAEYVPKLRPAFCYADRVVTIGERGAAASAMLTIAASISIDADLDYLSKVWCELPDESKDKIIQLARESTN